MPPRVKAQKQNSNPSDDEKSSDDLSATDSGEDVGEDEHSISRQGEDVREIKKKMKRKGEKTKKDKIDKATTERKSQVRSNKKKGIDSDLDDDEEDEEERIDEHNRDTFFKVYFDEIVDRIKKDPGGPIVVNDVDFSNMDIGPHELKIFATAIMEHFKITGKPCYIHYMNFSACRLCGFDYKTKPPPVFEDLYESSESKTTSLCISQTSDFQAASQWDHGGFRKFMKLLKYARGGTTVHALNLRKNPLGRQGCEILKDFLMPVRQSCITDLNLARCGISVEGLRSLSKAVCKNRSLSRLILQGNKLGALSGPLFAKIVAQNKSLVILDLSQTDFNSGAVCMFVSSLFQIGTPNGPNRKLTTFILSENDICDVGAKAMSSLLQAENMRLLHLDLQGNRLSSTGANYLAKGIRKNKFLLYLGLQWNHIDDVGAKQLGKAITRNTSLRGLFLMGNNVTQEGARLILEGSLTFDDTPITIDLESLAIRPRDERTEVNAELDRTREEAERHIVEIAANEAKFSVQEVAFHSIVHRNDLGEEITEEESESLIDERALNDVGDFKDSYLSFDHSNDEHMYDITFQNEDVDVAALKEEVDAALNKGSSVGRREDEEDDDVKMNFMDVDEIMHLFEIHDNDDLND